MRIRKLKLYTPNIENQQDFYTRILGLAQEASGHGEVSFRVGDTLLSFEQKASATPYHFAINIPSHSELAALTWLKERVPILTDHGRELQDFKAWNAHSVYFYDSDKNIVELISRRNLGYAFDAPMGPQSFKEISEIGLAVPEIPPYFKQLQQIMALPLYDGDLEQFSAIGDELGLFICINRHSKTWYPAGDPAHPSEFEALASSNRKEYRISYHGERLEISPGEAR